MFAILTHPNCVLMTSDSGAIFSKIVMNKEIEFTFVSRVPIPHGEVLGYASHKLFTYDSDNFRLYAIGDDSNIQFKTILQLFLCVALTCLVYCDPGYGIHKCPLDLEDDKLLVKSKSPVCCMEISVEFHLVVLGTVTAHVRLCSLIDGRDIATVSIEGELPVAVLVTRSSGFVIARTPASLFVITTNGSLVRRCSLSIAIVSWRTFSSRSGFDYLVMHDRNKELFVSEVMHPEKVVRVGKCHKLVAVNYYNKRDCFILLTTSGKVKILPFAVAAISPEPVVEVAPVGA